MSRPGVVVVGSLTVDLTSFSARRPAPGETVIGTDFTMVAGGKGANQALAAAALGAPTWMVGCVGDDDFAGTVLSSLRSGAVDTGAVRSVAGTRTGVAHIRVESSGDNDIVIVPLANAALATDDVDTAMARYAPSAGAVLVQLEIPVEVAAWAVKAAHAAGLVTVLDPAPAPGAGLPDDVYADVDVIVPNETEASLLSGVTVTDEASAAAAGRWFVDRGCRAAVVTLGGAGCVLAVPGETPRLLPAYAVDAVDSTAAGDAFAGALGARLAAGDSLAEALSWARAAGALATTVPGASTSVPSAAAVQELLVATPGGGTR